MKIQLNVYCTCKCVLDMLKYLQFYRRTNLMHTKFLLSIFVWIFVRLSAGVGGLIFLTLDFYYWTEFIQTLWRHCFSTHVGGWSGTLLKNQSEDNYWKWGVCVIGWDWGGGGRNRKIAKEKFRFPTFCGLGIRFYFFQDTTEERLRLWKGTNLFVNK